MHTILQRLAPYLGLDRNSMNWGVLYYPLGVFAVIMFLGYWFVERPIMRHAREDEERARIGAAWCWPWANSESKSESRQRPS